MDHVNKGMLRYDIPGLRMCVIVTIKLIEPINEENPAKCKDKIAIIKGLLLIVDKGGYKVQPLPISFNIKAFNNHSKEGANNQKLKLFNLG